MAACHVGKETYKRCFERPSSKTSWLIAMYASIDIATASIGMEMGLNTNLQALAFGTRISTSKAREITVSLKICSF